MKETITAEQTNQVKPHGWLVSFDEFLQYGRDNGANIVSGMPWSFHFHGHAVTHENDDLYLIGTPSMEFRRGECLIVTAFKDYSILQVLKPGVAALDAPASPAKEVVGWIDEFGHIQFTKGIELKIGDELCRCDTSKAEQEWDDALQELADIAQANDMGYGSKAEASSDAAQEMCPICCETQPHTGTCGSRDPKALCNRAAPSAAPAQQEPFAHFQWNSGWNHWEQVIPSAAGQDRVVAAYREPIAQPAAQRNDVIKDCANSFNAYADDQMIYAGSARRAILELMDKTTAPCEGVEWCSDGVNCPCPDSCHQSGNCLKPAAQRNAIIEAVDAAMAEMRNIHPPLRRSDCERLIRAALAGKTAPAAGGQEGEKA